MRTLLILAAAAFAGSTIASAQVMYGGYNLGPDYGAMIQSELAKQQVMNQQMEQQAAAIVEQAMRSPDCQMKYQQHLAAGGQMPYPQFAYQYAATAGFTADGIARYRASEANNQRHEMDALRGVREAEGNLGAALAEGAEHYAHNQAIAGETLQGNARYVDTMTNQTRTLPYLGENALYTDPNSGQNYYRDAYGRYYAQAPNGAWYEMTPAR